MPLSLAPPVLLRLLLGLAGLTAATVCPAQETPTYPATLRAIASPTLLGTQLAAKREMRQGRMSAATGACIQALTPQAFYPVIDDLLQRLITREEALSLEAFLGSPLGRKYLKHGLLKIYAVAGEQAPEQIAGFSDREVLGLEKFSASSGGRAFIDRAFMMEPKARQALRQRTQELVLACHESPALPTQENTYK